MNKIIINKASFLLFCEKEIKSHENYKDDWEITDCITEETSLNNLKEAGWKYGGEGLTVHILCEMVDNVMKEYNIERVDCSQ